MLTLLQQLQEHPFPGGPASRWMCRADPSAARKLQICTIFFRSMALICRFWGISFDYKVNGQKYAGQNGPM